METDKVEMIEAYWLLLYDDECPLCSRFASWIRRLDPHNIIRTVPLQTYALQADYPGREQLETDVHMLGRNGEILVGGEVVRKIVEIIPAMRPFRWMMEGETGKKAARFAYLTMKRFRDCPGCGKRRRR